MQHLRRRKAHGLQLAIVVVMFMALQSVSAAQSCALCYTQAASAGHRLIQGLRTGILVLIVPPMFMSVGITVLAYKKRNRTNDDQQSPNSRNDW